MLNLFPDFKLYVIDTISNQPMVTSESVRSLCSGLFRDYQVTGKAEIGAHLHSWTTSPYRDRDGLRLNDRNHTFAHELPDLLLNEKIKILTEQIEKLWQKTIIIPIWQVWI